MEIIRQILPVIGFALMWIGLVVVALSLVFFLPDGGPRLKRGEISHMYSTIVPIIRAEIELPKIGIPIPGGESYGSN